MQDEILRRAFRLAKSEIRDALAAEPPTSLGRHKLAVARQEFLGEVHELAGKWFDAQIHVLRKKKKKALTHDSLGTSSLGTSAPRSTGNR